MELRFVGILSLNLAHFEVQLGGLIDHKLVESQRPLEHSRSFSSHSPPGSLPHFTEGKLRPREAISIDFLKMHNCLRAWLCLHTFTRQALHQRRAGRRKFLRLLGVKVRLPTHHPGLPHPHGLKFLR